MSTTVKSSAKKRVSESEASKPEKLKRDAIEDDFDAALSDDIKGIVSTLQLIREKAQKDGQKKIEETIPRFECESGLFFDIKYFEELVVNGDWDEADRYLSCFTKWDDNRHSMKMFFEIKKQKYFEALDKCNFHEAADILTNELKVFSESDQELTKEMTDLLKNKREHRQLTGHANMEIQRKNLMGMLFNKLLINHPIISEKLQFPTLADSTLKHQFPKGSPNYSDASLASQSAHLVPVGQIEVGQVEPLQTIARPVPDPLSLPQNNLPTINQQGGSKPKSKPKKEKTEEERKFRRWAKYFLVTQLVAVLVFLSLLGGSDDAEVELDDDDSLNYND